MRHRNSGRKFDRNTSAGARCFATSTANLVLHERIETTDAKAKELRRVAERLITKARRLGETAYTPLDKLDAKARVRRLATERQISAYMPRPFATKTEKGGEEKKVNLVEKVLVDLAQALQRSPGRLHAHHQVRSAPR